MSQYLSGVHLCASLFYFRLPREVWAERLEAVAASGYDTIDVYLPWNFHEVAPGEWDFTGRRDAGAFLDLAAQAGLKVIARPGPYICSEWDGGALPAWLTLTEGLQLRQAEPRYLAAVAAWFEKVLPILVERQADRGGAVVAVQVENELDFFDSLDRAAYVGALAEQARAAGLSVPLVACAGQGDLVGASGGVPGVIPAFNFYPSDASADIEPEVRHYAALMAGRGEPLLVTETNRAHVTLRRLLASGANLLAPYLQGSGYDFGYTPSVGNWGNPGGFMTHDYDFGGYLSPTGRPRPEMARGRALAGVIATLGPAMADAVPEAADGAYETDAPTASSPSRLALAGGGTLLAVPNLGETAATARVGDIEIDLAPFSCTYVLADLPLGGYGLPGLDLAGSLRFASADLVGIGPDGLELAAEAASVLVLAGPDGEVRLDLAAPVPGAPVTASAGGVPVTVRHPEDLVAGTAAAVDPTFAEPVDGAAGVPVRLALPVVDGAAQAHELPPASEALGVYRGRTHSAADVGAADLGAADPSAADPSAADSGDAVELLIAGAGDIVDLRVDGRALPTLAGFGATVVVPGGARLEATAETWGHANFDDHRLPGLRMGSLRGLGTVSRVLGREDVGALWTVSGEGQWAGPIPPVRTLGGWSSSRIGAPVTYARELPVDGEHSYALRIDGVPGAATVTVDGGPAVALSADDPWLHLAAGQRSVAVTVPHVPGALAGAELFRLEPVRGWSAVPQSDADLLALAGTPAPGTPAPLPLAVEPGEEFWLDVPVPAGGWSMRFAGRQVRVSAFAGGELLGRVWLEDAAAPPFTGGDPGRLWLPAAWNGGAVRLLVHATAGPAAPELTSMRLTAARQ